ncbi:MAG: hypothetical protein ACRBHB_11545 [Arenicella sp.]
MSRKDKPFIRRVFGTISSFVLIAASGYALFTGFNVLTGLIIGLAILSIATPVVIDAIASIFNF